MPKIFALYDGQVQWVDFDLITTEKVWVGAEGFVSVDDLETYTNVWSYGGSFAEYSTISGDENPEPENLFRTVSIGDSIDITEDDARFTLSGFALGTSVLDPEGATVFVEVTDIGAPSDYDVLPVGAFVTVLIEVTANDESMFSGGVGEYGLIEATDDPEDLTNLLTTIAGFGVTTTILTRGVKFTENTPRPFTVTPS